MAFTFKDKYGIEDLLEIMTILRSPNGCPWDKVQDHHSLRRDFIEETYEAISAIDNEDTENLREELGDVLLQVVFHSEIERENGAFDFSDVCHDVCAKMILRHPHVFADAVAETPEDVLRSWELIKADEKGMKKTSESIDAIPKCLPSLMRARKIQKKAADVGFDWDSVDGAFDKITEETRELREAIDSGEKSAINDELGDLLFAAVNVSRFVGADAEQSLGQACDKFAERFRFVEKLADERGIDMKSAGIEELDKLWDEAKQIIGVIHTV